MSHPPPHTHTHTHIYKLLYDWPLLQVAVWGAYFNATSTDGVHGELNGRTVDAILAFMPSQPIWAFHGSAYGMGDFSNNAKYASHLVPRSWSVAPNVIIPIPC